MPARLRLNPKTHAAFQIVALANRISSSASRAYLTCFDVGVMEWRALALVGLRPGITAAEISQVSGIDKAPVSRAVRSLAERGFMRAEEDAGDNRRALLFLTATGEALHDRVIRASLAREERFLTGLSAEERRGLFALLERLAANIALLHGPEPAARTRRSARGAGGVGESAAVALER